MYVSYTNPEFSTVGVWPALELSDPAWGVDPVWCLSTEKGGNPSCFHFLRWRNLLKVNNLVLTTCQTLCCLAEQRAVSVLGGSCPLCMSCRHQRFTHTNTQEVQGALQVYSETLKLVWRGPGQLSWALTLRRRQCWQWQRLIKGGGIRTYIQGNVRRI